MRTLFLFVVLLPKCCASRTSLTVVGPAGTRAYVRSALAFSQAILTYPYVIHELHPERTTTTGDASEGRRENEQIGQDIAPSDADRFYDVPIGGGPAKAGWKVRAGEIEHRVTCFGFVLVEPVRCDSNIDAFFNTSYQDLAGTVDATKVRPLLEAQREALAASGVKNPLSLLATLKAGTPVTLPDGHVIQPSDCVGAPRPGRRLAILGDTSDPARMRELCRNCDVLIHEATNANIGLDGGLGFNVIGVVSKPHLWCRL